MSIGTVAVLGTGIMGAPMARNIAASGIEVYAWNRTPGRAGALAAEAVTVAESAAQAAARADIVVTMLADGPAVDAVMRDGVIEAMRPDAIWVQMSTVGVEWNAGLAEMAADAGVGFVDAPVMGTRQPAEAGALVVLASGPADLVARAEPVFTAIGSKTIEAGPVGAGQRLKLVVNNWVLGLLGILAESIATAEALDLDPKEFLAAIAGTGVDAGYAQMKGAAMIEDEHAPNFPLRLARKDVALILEATGDRGLTLPVAAAVHHLLGTAESAGHGDADMSAVRKALADD